jgi:hypothetical protein
VTTRFAIAAYPGIARDPTVTRRRRQMLEVVCEQLTLAAHGEGHHRDPHADVDLWQGQLPFRHEVDYWIFTLTYDAIEQIGGIDAIEDDCYFLVLVDERDHSVLWFTKDDGGGDTQLSLLQVIEHFAQFCTATRR